MGIGIPIINLRQSDNLLRFDGTIYTNKAVSSEWIEALKWNPLCQMMPSGIANSAIGGSSNGLLPIQHQVRGRGYYTNFFCSVIFLVFQNSQNTCYLLTTMFHRCHIAEHYNGIMMASQITSLTIVYSSVYSGPDQRKHQSPASLAFVRGIHWWPVNSRHKGTVVQKMLPFDNVIMAAIAGMLG